jgi:hypothetical protein
VSRSTIVTLERLLACLGNGGAARVEIMRRLRAGIASVQPHLRVCVANGLLRRMHEADRYVWWRSTPPGQVILYGVGRQ